jgi:hypothetical protein
MLKCNFSYLDVKKKLNPLLGLYMLRKMWYSRNTQHLRKKMTIYHTFSLSLKPRLYSTALSSAESRATSTYTQSYLVLIIGKFVLLY